MCFINVKKDKNDRKDFEELNLEAELECRFEDPLRLA